MCVNNESQFVLSDFRAHFDASVNLNQNVTLVWGKGEMESRMPVYLWLNESLLNSKCECISSPRTISECRFGG